MSTLSSENNQKQETARRTTDPRSRFHTIIGPPGTGKTRTIAEAVSQHVADVHTQFGEMPADHRGQHPAAVVSLTRAAAAEAAGRTGLPRDAVGTLHSFAYRFLGSPALATSRELLDDWNQHHPMETLSGGTAGDLEAPAEAATSGGADGDGDKMMQLYTLRRAQCLPRDQWGAALLRFAKQWEQWKHDVDALDFADLIDQAAEQGMPSPGRHLYADEAQDLSEQELRLLRVMAQTCVSMHLVGDPDQALFTWRGAKPEMFADERIPAANRRVLEQSYRVPRAVHEAAVRLISGVRNRPPITYHPTDEPGEMKRLKGASYTNPDPLRGVIDEELAAGRSVMIAAACEYHLPRTLKMLRDYAVPFSNPWRRRAGQWNPMHGGGGLSACDRLLAMLRADEGTAGEEAMIWTYGELERWTAPLKATGTLRRGARAEIELAAGSTPDDLVSMDDLRKWFEADPADGEPVLAGDVLRLAPVPDRPDAERAAIRERVVNRWVESCQPKRRCAALFAAKSLLGRGADAIRDEPRVYVGTIHSFKGAEADTVILYPDVSPAAIKRWDAVERDELLRQYYVALTRARRTVYLCDRGSQCAMPMEMLT